MNANQIFVTNLMLAEYEADILRSIIDKLLTIGFVKPELSLEEQELLKTLKYIPSERIFLNQFSGG